MRTGSLLLTLLLAAAPAAGQQTEDLTGLMDTLAALWSEGDAAALAAYGARPGLDLEVRGRTLEMLEGRRAAAALRQLFGAQETVAVETGAAARVSGAEDRAFGELIWSVRMPGAAVAERHKIFMALVQQNEEWRISQIRILH